MQKGHSIVFLQSRGPLKGAITASTAAMALPSKSIKVEVHTVHSALFAVILPSHAALLSCYDFCGFHYKDLITVMAEDKQASR